MYKFQREHCDIFSQIDARFLSKSLDFMLDLTLSKYFGQLANGVSIFNLRLDAKHCMHNKRKVGSVNCISNYIKKY